MSLWGWQLAELKFIAISSVSLEKNIDYETKSPSSAVQKAGRSKHGHLPTKTNCHTSYFSNVKIHAGVKIRPFQLTLCL